MNYDVVIVGAGPAGLSAAIKLKQLSQTKGHDISLCVVEKGSEVGAHILSGNVFEPRALNELVPNWKEKEAAVGIPAAGHAFKFLTKNYSIPLPNPPQMNNNGNYVMSLSGFVRWLGKEAEELGVEIYPGFAASEVVYDSSGRVQGIATRDMGIDKTGKPKDTYTPGVEILGKLTLFGEGCRGSLTKTLEQTFGLRKDCQHQTYGLGIKEVWEIPAEKHRPGFVMHSIGYPLDFSTYGGGFLYHMANNQVAVGFVVALDYSNPYLSPYGEFQRYKSHPAIRSVLEGGTCISYGARTLNEGGFQSIPKLDFPGGALIGCSAGFLNVPKIKGTHTAMKSGMLAAEAAFESISGQAEPSMSKYPEQLRESWIWKELYQERNIRPAFKFGLPLFLAYSSLEAFVLKGKAPWTLKHHAPDNECLKLAKDCKPIEYPKPDGALTFDIPTSLYRSGTNHDHDQPSHLTLKDPAVPDLVNWPKYAGPEGRFCPARVYEYVPVEDSPAPKLQINAQNCLHCKACDIKDPTQNINWVVPEGGGDPAYTTM